MRCVLFFMFMVVVDACLARNAIVVSLPPGTIQMPGNIAGAAIESQYATAFIGNIVTANFEATCQRLFSALFRDPAVNDIDHAGRG